ncbi:GNAT family N-acetyltransferase [Lapillicoccus sp.]|uniref:GNAT family N-acetyltransferase n=1 Tax=Lapillicoccus sp. TaxID=1909287 RepID=UPI003267B8AE
MLRTHSPVRALTMADHDEALALCARNPAANVFVAARIEEGALRASPGSLLGFRRDGRLAALCWVSANVVPVECDDESADLFATRIRRWHKGCASIFGPSAQVLELWRVLQGAWGRARAVREHQPLMTTKTHAAELGLSADPRVRFARLEEVDLVLPAAAAMFTDEIGYPPYRGSSRGYRTLIAGLIVDRHTVVWVEDDEVLFKADVGSAAIGAAQIQGVWLTPRLRGQGLSRPLMSAATDLVIDAVAPLASLYVNDFNAPARALYEAIGYREVGSFTTVLL